MIRPALAPGILHPERLTLVVVTNQRHEVPALDLVVGRRCNLGEGIGAVDVFERTADVEIDQHRVGARQLPLDVVDPGIVHADEAAHAKVVCPLDEVRRRRRHTFVGER